MNTVTGLDIALVNHAILFFQHSFHVLIQYKVIFEFIVLLYFCILPN